MNRKTGIPVVLVAAMAVVALTPTAMAAGITHYSVSTGAFSSTFNPTLSGGEFDGLAYSELASTDFVGIRDGVGFEVALRGASGITHYSVVTGAFSSTFNPTLSGGEFDGLAYSEFASTDFVGIRDGVGFEVALVPEPGMLALLAIGGLTMLRRRRSG